MIVIYTQDETYIRNNANDARELLNSVYGSKLGEEAYKTVSSNRPGTSYRKYGGPLVKIVTKEEAETIRVKEKEIGMLKA